MNPYRPGAGRRPPVLAGRNDVLGEILDEMAIVEEDGVGEQPYIIWGLSGIGKTALVREFADWAHKRGWLAIVLEAAPGEDLAQRISQATALELRRFPGIGGKLGERATRALGIVKSFQLRFDPAGAVSLGMEVDSQQGYADTGNLAVDLQDLFRAFGEIASESGVAALVVIDELQEADADDLGALNRALHGIGQEIDPVPLVFIGAGLPSLPAVLADATSYAERLYRYFSIDLLPESECKRALREPAQREGVTWSDSALEVATAFSGGYPYLIQQCGRCAWQQRTEESTISADDCRAGIAVARDEVDRGLYRSRWERATAAEKAFMAAMAEDEGPSALADLTERLGKSQQKELSAVRASLIQAGHVYVSSRGKVAFAIPGMGDYIRRKHGSADV